MTAQRESSDYKSYLLERSLQLLGWDRIRERLASLAMSSATHPHCLRFLPENDHASALARQNETAEMHVLLESVEGFPLDAFADIAPVVRDAEQRQTLDPPQCLAVLKFLLAVKRVKMHMSKRAEIAPATAGLCAGLDSLTPLADNLDRCIDEDGEIRDNATPELRQAIREVAQAKDKLQTTVSRLLSGAEFREAIQDAYHTEREGRWVLPVKVEWRARVEGIVHDSSGSGATVYMEPTHMVEGNNRLKLARIRVAQEKARILRSLAGEINAASPVLLENQRLLVKLDFIRSRARLAKEMRAVPCRLLPFGFLNLKQARNPELLLAGRDVIANDLIWPQGVRVVIISGPNTGGKTATLKTAGLAAVMARSGLFLPVAADSEMGFYPEVYADIGDEQSLRLNLSTFSAHMEKIAGILHHAAPGSLVLLDELGISTDPEEGAALAEAILSELSRRGMTTLVSTHYLSLKLLAQSREDFVNACAEFDAREMRPTYRLISGAPGNSAALATARRLGLPSDIVRRAEEIFKARETDAGALLQKLNDRLLELDHEREALGERSRELSLLHEEQTRIVNKQREDLREFNRAKNSKLQEQLRNAKQELRQLIDQAKASGKVADARAAEKKIRSLSHQSRAGDAPSLEGWDLPPDQLREGDAVIIDTYGKRGTLIDDPSGKSVVRIRLGNLVTSVAKERLRGNSDLRKSRKPSAHEKDVSIHLEAQATGRLSCNLHGMRYDDAQRTLEEFLNQAVAGRAERVVIRHGRGSGALREMVRDYLEKYGYGKSFRPGSSDEGGDGVTVVEF